MWPRRQSGCQGGPGSCTCQRLLQSAVCLSVLSTSVLPGQSWGEKSLFYIIVFRLSSPADCKVLFHCHKLVTLACYTTDLENQFSAESGIVV